MRKWEYKVENREFPLRLGAAYANQEAEWLNEMDESGWELVAVDTHWGSRYYFRRGIDS